VRAGGAAAQAVNRNVVLPQPRVRVARHEPPASSAENPRANVTRPRAAGSSGSHNGSAGGASLRGAACAWQRRLAMATQQRECTRTQNGNAYRGTPTQGGSSGMFVCGVAASFLPTAHSQTPMVNGVAFVRTSIREEQTSSAKKQGITNVARNEEEEITGSSAACIIESNVQQCSGIEDLACGVLKQQAMQVKQQRAKAAPKAKAEANMEEYGTSHLHQPFSSSPSVA